jgi:hypothetical protein
MKKNLACIQIDKYDKQFNSSKKHRKEVDIQYINLMFSYNRLDLDMSKISNKIK